MLGKRADRWRRLVPFGVAVPPSPRMPSPARHRHHHHRTQHTRRPRFFLCKTGLVRRNHALRSRRVAGPALCAHSSAFAQRPAGPALRALVARRLEAPLGPGQRRHSMSRRYSAARRLPSPPPSLTTADATRDGHSEGGAAPACGSHRSCSVCIGCAPAGQRGGG